MYYVDEKQIEKRLDFIPLLSQSIQQLKETWRADDILHALAEERVLHLAIETVTDIGSYLIDGLMLREASSYEDIMQVLADEEVFSDETFQSLHELVRLRRPLVQQYVDWERGKPHRLLGELDNVLQEFHTGVVQFLERELPDYALRKNGG